MPKKKTTKKSEFKNLLKEFAEKSVKVLVTSIEKINILALIKNLSNIKEKARKYISALILTVAGTVALALGIAAYLAYLVPALANGLSQMIVGAVLIIIASIICRSGR